MAVGIPGYTQAAPVTSIDQGIQAGQSQQMNALAVQQAQQSQSDNNALRNALSVGYANPSQQGTAMNALAAQAPNKVPDFNQAMVSVTQSNMAQMQQKAQSVAQQLGALVNVPDGPQREQAYQSMLNQEQSQGLDVSAMRALPANQGIRVAFQKVQSVQDQAKQLAPQTFDLAAGTTRTQYDPITGQSTQIGSAPTKNAGLQLQDLPTGKMVNGQPVYAKYWVAPGQAPVPVMGGAGPQASTGGMGAPSGMQAAIIGQESGGNPNAVSPKGAQGLMQLMPATAANPGFGIQPAQNNSPQENQRVGMAYYNAMINRYGNQMMALAAYNAGPGSVDKALQAANGDPNKALAMLPAETQNYVPAVLARLQGQGGQSSSDSGGGGSMPSPNSGAQAVTGTGGQGAPAQPQASADDASAQLGAGEYVKDEGKGNVIQQRQADVASLKAAGVPVSDQQAQTYLTTGKYDADSDGTLSPGDEATAQAIASYKAPISPLSLSKPTMQPIIARALAINPNFSAAQYDTNRKSMMDMAATTPTSAGGTMLAAGAALGHLNDMADIAQRLPNTTFASSLPYGNAIDQLGNTLRNGAASGPQSTSITDWDTAKNLLAGEASKMVKGGVASEAEVSAMLSNLSVNNPNRNEALATLAKFMNDKVDAIQAKRDGIMGPASGGTSLLTGPQQDMARRVIGLSPNYTVPQFSAPGGMGQQNSAQGQPPSAQGPSGVTSMPQVAHPQSQADYNAIPAGAKYIGKDGVTVYTKGQQ